MTPPWKSTTYTSRTNTRSEALPLDHDTILKGLAVGWPDFEDALQMLCAVTVGADYLVTRNTRDLRSASIPVVTPTELLAIVRAEGDDDERAEEEQEEADQGREDEAKDPNSSSSSPTDA